MKLVAALACRNKSTRLYAKPIQNLDVTHNITILDYMVAQFKQCIEIDDIVLAISENPENSMYRHLADDYGISYVLGDDEDVLGRLIKAADSVNADHVLRVTTESPFIYLDNLSLIYREHCERSIDYSGTKGLPDGSYYEIISLAALKKSWAEGSKKHRSELCTLFIFENKDKFSIAEHDVPAVLKRDDMRLTVDWPEDLIVMRKIYEDLKLSLEEKMDFERIIQYLDQNPRINAINNWIDSGIGRIWY